MSIETKQCNRCLCLTDEHMHSLVLAAIINSNFIVCFGCVLLLTLLGKVGIMNSDQKRPVDVTDCEVTVAKRPKHGTCCSDVIVLCIYQTLSVSAVHQIWLHSTAH